MNGLTRGRRPAENMVILVRHIVAGLMLWALMPAAAQAQGYPGYPYSIMTPEHGFEIHQRPIRQRGTKATETTRAMGATNSATTQPRRPRLLGREIFVAKLHRRGLYAVHGSSGSVLAVSQNTIVSYIRRP